MTARADSQRPCAKPCVPPGSLVYAIGDIHGCLSLLDDLLSQIVEDAGSSAAERRVLVFVGDYIDRGPDSAGVIERLSSGLPQGFESICLKGNHEALMLDFLKNPATSDRWYINGGETTMASYGVRPELLGDPAIAAACRDAFIELLPARHQEFFETLKLSAAIGDYFFAHAGIDPAVPLDRQRPDDLMWIRDPFLEWAEDFGKFVIHGHTPVREPEVRANRIDIDTGAWMRGTLTALCLEGSEKRFLATDPR